MGGITMYICECDHYNMGELEYIHSELSLPVYQALSHSQSGCD